jgi:TP901 family phage tail tape measure protein
VNTVEIALKLAIGDFMAKTGAVSARARQVGKDLSDTSSTASRGLQKVGPAALVMGGAVAAGFALAAHAALNFDKQMSEVQAVTGATSEEMGQLRQSAIDAGAATVFSASEAAQAQTELAKAGVGTADILNGALDGALNLASAGNLDLATAAELAANAMTTFKLSGSDVPRIADALAAGANKSAADVDDMGIALQQTGLVADQVGLSLEDTVGVLSMFAQAGLKGSDAGTSLKTMLMRLNPQTAEAREAMGELGLEMYDAQGNFVGITSAAQQLSDKLGPLTQEQRQAALQTIFGSDAIRAATVLYQNGGAGVDQWRDAVSESGYAADLAATKTDNLAGDLEQLKGSLETALIQGGSQATGALRGVAQGLTGVINGLGEMPAPIQTAFLGTAGLIGLGATSIGIYGTLAPKVREVTKALSEMGPVAQALGRNLGTMTIATAGVGIALAALSYLYSINAQKAAEQQERTDGYTSAIEKQTGALQDNINAETARQFAQGSVGKLLHETTADVELFGRAIATSGDEIERLSDQARTGRLENFEEDLRKGAESGSRLATELLRLKDSGELSTTELMSLAKALDESSDALDEGTTQAELNKGMKEALVGADEDATAAAEQLAIQTGQTAQEFADAEKALQDLDDQLNAFITSALGIDRAYDSVHSAINQIADDAKAVREDAGGAFDGTSDAAIRLRDTLGGVVDSGAELVMSMREQGKSTDEIRFALGNLGAAFLDQAEKAGVPREVAQRYYDLLMALPDQVPTEIGQPGMPQALTDTQALNHELSIARLGAVGVIAVPGADGAIRLTNDLNEELGIASEGAQGAVSVPGADGSWYAVWLVNGQLQVAKQGAHGVVSLDTSRAHAAISELQRHLGTVQANAARTYIPGISLADGGILAAYANGGIHQIDSYATGGMRRGLAGIAPANSHVLFAETTATGDEAYIPLGSTKRARSMAIWEETGRRLGAGSGGTVVHMSVSAPINAPGADPSSVRAMRRELEQVIDGATDRIARQLDRQDRKRT